MSNQQLVSREIWWKYNKRQVIINAGLLLIVAVASAATHILTYLMMPA